MYNRNLLTVLTVSTISALSLAPSASAQISLGVNNTIKNSNGTEFNRSNLKLDQNTDFYQVSEAEGNAQTIKLEGFAENVTVNLDFDGSKFTGDVTATNETPVDPVALGAFQNTDIYQFSETAEDTSLKGRIRSGSDSTFNQIDLNANTYLNR